MPLKKKPKKYLIPSVSFFLMIYILAGKQQKIASGREKKISFSKIIKGPTKERESHLKRCVTERKRINEKTFNNDY